MRLSTATLLSIALAVAGCGDGSGRPADGAPPDGGPPDATPDPDGDVADAATDASGDAATDASGDAATDGGAADGLSIEFDYRFDTSGFFDPPERRRALEAAARIWSEHLVDDFEDIPSGTTVRVQDPEDLEASGMNFVIDRDIDDLLVFVACASLGGPNGFTRTSAAIGSVEDPELRSRLDERWFGNDYEPWTSAISFECSSPWFFDSTPETADDIPSEQVDFITVVLHELAHALGFGGSDAFTAWVSGATFTGPEATSVYGEAVPLSSDGAHFEMGVLHEGGEPLLDPGKAAGLRVPPTPLDVAALADIGYEPSGG